MQLAVSFQWTYGRVFTMCRGAHRFPGSGGYWTTEASGIRNERHMLIWRLQTELVSYQFTRASEADHVDDPDVAPGRSEKVPQIVGMMYGYRLDLRRVMDPNHDGYPSNCGPIYHSWQTTRHNHLLNLMPSILSFIHELKPPFFTRGLGEPV